MTEPTPRPTRLRAMRHHPHLGRLSAGTLVLSWLLVACTSAGGGAASSPAVSPAGPPPASTSELPSASAPASDDGNGTIGQPSGDVFVVPKPGQLDVKPIMAEEITAAVDGRHVVLTIAWTSGVEPCYVLDSIVVQQGDHAFGITLREGHGPEDVMCIQIAERHQTQVDLGELEPGTYTITDAQGGAAPIEVTVS
jgi:hypothetical protein